LLLNRIAYKISQDFFVFQADDLNSETDSKKACLSSSVESTATHSEVSNDISLNNKNSASNQQNSLVDGDTEHNHTNKQILQEIYSARFYFYCN